MCIFLFCFVPFTECKGSNESTYLGFFFLKKKKHMVSSIALINPDLMLVMLQLEGSLNNIFFTRLKLKILAYYDFSPSESYTANIFYSAMQFDAINWMFGIWLLSFSWLITKALRRGPLDSKNCISF